MKSFLTAEEREYLRSYHSESIERRSADRIKTILALDSGMSFEEVSEILLLDSATIRRYLKRYERGGIERLVEDNRGGSISRLSIGEQRELKSHLESKLYTCTQAIAEYVSQTYRVNYTVRGMHHLLVRLGFVYKKTKAIPGKADPEKQELFVDMYEELMDRKNEDDPVYFIDGVHAQHNSHPTFGWILRGKEHQIPTNTGRKRVNFNGALNAETLGTVVREDNSINADSTVALFAGIEQQHQEAKNIYVILDNAGYYRNRKVTYYVENSKIQLLFLPPYSPNLNLIERLWKFFKKKVSANRYYESFQEFKNASLAFFKKLQLYDSELDSLLTDNFEIIRPDFVA